MSYECPNCEHNFDDRTALCEDWRIPDKAFGCPKCETFLTKQIRPGRSQWAGNISAIAYLVFFAVYGIGGFVGTPSKSGLAILLVGAVAGAIQLYQFWQDRKIQSFVLIPIEPRQDA